MSGFYEEAKDIYRLKIPFDTVYTSVFLIKSPSGTVLVDCASSDKDVTNYIAPALKEIGCPLSEIKSLILTHSHGDHAGGLSQLLALAQNIELIRDVREIFDGICTYPMAGHTKDSIGVLDRRSHTLISGDGLQGAGVGKFRCYTELPEAYLETLETIANDKRIENILFSHAYEPWNNESAFGRKEVDHCLLECQKYIQKKSK